MVDIGARGSSERQPATRAARGRLLAAALALGLLPLLVIGPAPVSGAPAAGITPSTAAGDTAAAIRPVVDSFRNTLGLDNGNGGTFATGRREITWDNVPDAQAAPNNLPPNYYNTSVPRGVILSTRGTGLQVSAAPATTIPVRFGNLHPTYTALFHTYSSPRLFTPLGSTRFEASFFLPGTTTPATVSAFGAVFSDVDDPNTSGIEFFDAQGSVLGQVFAPPGLLSFAGGRFDGVGARIARVRVTTGNTPLAEPDRPTAIDVVAVDDLIFAEPQGSAAAPTPTAAPTAAPLPVTLTVQQALAQVAVSGQPGLPAVSLPGQSVAVVGRVSGTGVVNGSMAWSLTAVVPAGVVAGSGPVAVISTTQGLQGFVCATVPVGAASVACNGNTPANVLLGSTVTVVFPGGGAATGVVTGAAPLAAPPPPILLPPVPPPFLAPVPPLVGAGPLAPSSAPEVPVIPEADPLLLVLGGLLALGAVARHRGSPR
jgi:hypothetical protein